MSALPMRRRVVSLLALVAIWLTGSAHVGSTIVVQDGTAGPYGLRVLVRPPAVIPGLVDVVIRTTTPNALPTAVTLQPAIWRYGTKGAPAPENAVAVPGEPGTFQTQVWIMSSGSYALHIAASGPAGKGEFIVPYTSVASATLGMPNWLGWVLAALGAFLVFGLASLIGSASREGTLPIGAAPNSARLRRARFATGIAGLIAGTLMFGGWTWWNAVERDYRNSLFRPIPSEAHVTAGPQRTLTLHITDTTWRLVKPGERLRVGRSSNMTPLMPDHGKLMHMFLVAAGGTGAVAHLHPVRTDERTFVTPVAAIPAGRYWLYADVVHESGAARTMVDTVEVPAGDATPSDADDAVALSPANVTAGPVTLPDGMHIAITVEGTPVVGRDVVFHTHLTNADGSTATLLPWLGMAGHAMLLRTDGAVFMHLHPSGTASMAAQNRLARREAGDTAMHGDSQPMDMAAMHMSPVPGDVRFPVAFPSAGAYRVFVQVLTADHQYRTAVIALTVP